MTIISPLIAVIDIGSNSVRLVIYDGLKRSPMSVFNEKILCGLANNLEQTGKLSIDGAKRAKLAIGRFLKLSKIMHVKEIHLFATSAVRDAKDGNSFAKDISRTYGYKINILTGQQEAEFAGFGVISSISEPKGVVGDLGGGSLELIAVSDTKIGTGQSLPIGPLRFLDNDGFFNKRHVQKIIQEYLQEFPLEYELENNHFYAVGGAFRRLASIHITKNKYPLRVVQNYKVPVKDIMKTVELVSRMSQEVVCRTYGISNKRSSLLPFAALLLKEIIAAGKPKNIVFSATGVREGFLYSKLSKKVKNKDPLLSGCEDMIARISRDCDYGYELSDWIFPLFRNISEHEKRLMLGACILSEISCYENTEYKAELAYRRVLDSSLTGLNHKERVFIAKSLYCRYSRHPDEAILKEMQPLLNARRFKDAQIIGSSMRLARSLSGSIKGGLQGTSLSVKNGRLILHISKDKKELAGEVVEKRMRQLGEVMSLGTIVNLI